MADIAHIAGLVAAGLHPSPIAVRRLRHHHHPQDAARAARRHDHVPGSRTPRRSTRPCSPASRAGRSCTSSPPRPSPSGRRSTPEWQGLPAADRRERQGAGRRRCWPAATGWSRAAPTTTCCWSTCRRKNVTGKDAAGGARPGVDHRQQEHDPVRDEEPDGHQRHPHRHAGGHHARHEGGRDGAIADLIDRVLGASGRRRGGGGGAGEVQELTVAFPLYPGATSEVKCPFCGHTEDRVVDSRVGRDGRVHPPPPRVPQVPPALHDLRVHRGRAAPRGQARRPPRALRPRRSCAARSSRPARSARSASRRSTTWSPTSRPSSTSGREGDLQPRAGRDGDGASPAARPGRLRALRLGLPPVQGHHPVHGRGEGPASRTTSAKLAPPAKPRVQVGRVAR